MNYKEIMTRNNPVPNRFPTQMRIEAQANGKWFVRDFFGNILASGKARNKSSGEKQAREYKSSYVNE